MSVDRGTVIVFGATSGIARATCIELAVQGYNLFLAARDPEELSRLKSDLEIRSQTKVSTGVFEAANHKEHQEFLESAIRKVGEIDGVVVCFGYLGDQHIAQDNWQVEQEILSRNFLDAASILHCCANYLESKRSGWIAALTSVAGDRGRMSNYVYGSAKGGLTIYLQGLRARLQKCGVHVLTVKPGPVDTAMTFGMEKLPLLADPKAVGKTIVSSIRKQKDVVYVPSPWRLIMFVFRTVPEKIFKKTSL